MSPPTMDQPTSPTAEPLVRATRAGATITPLATPAKNAFSISSPRRRFGRQLRRGLVSFLTSFVVHLGLLLGLALWVCPRVEKSIVSLELTATPVEALLEMFDPVPSPIMPSLDDTYRQVAEVDLPVPGMASWPAPDPGRHLQAILSPDTSRPSIDDLLRRSHAVVGGGYEGRQPQLRAHLAKTRGGSVESEQSVELGLAWLAAHQWADGGWRFDHTLGPCQGSCRDPGRVATTTGATGLALLPFLGAGYTHQQGPYREVVQRGLYYLSERMIVTPNGGDLQEGTMYAQGIATLALCEAYAMTGDPNLRSLAQQAVDFICWAQHPQGGWRYVPGQPGDTTVFGWQIMALKSARLANLEVPSPVIELAMRYLDSVQAHDGATYGYQKPGNEPSPTAIGLLARMYYGWRRNDPRLIRGVGILETLGPSDHDVYFDYYATQVLHHFQGSGWERWNQRLRDYLVATQAKNGHERGSWFFPDRHGSLGGRHYTTCMCIMILEVYYRHMPLYDAPAVEVGF